MNIDEGLGSRWRPVVCSIANDLPESSVHFLLICKKTETFQRSMAVPMSIRIFLYSRRTHVWYGRVKQRRLLSIAGLWMKRDKQTTTYTRTKKWNRTKSYADASSQTTATLPCPHTISAVFHLLPFSVSVVLGGAPRTSVCVCVCAYCPYASERTKEEKKANHVLWILVVHTDGRATQWHHSLAISYTRTFRSFALVYSRYLLLSAEVSGARALVFVRIAFVFGCSKRAQYYIGVSDTWPPPLENSTQHTILLSFQSVTTENT